MRGAMGQQKNCKTLIGVHLTMHLMHPNYSLATVTYWLATKVIIGNLPANRDVGDCRVVQ